ncbi:MAG: hypothetical protein WCG25_01060 [bacterium]
MNRVLILDLQEKEIQELDEMHIWRESQLDQFTDETKKYSLIKKIV